MPTGTTEQGTTDATAPRDPFEEDERTYSTTLMGDGGGPKEPYCYEADDCETAICFEVGIFGFFCSECASDADCEWGCSPPRPLGEPPTGATCNGGGFGDGCQTDDACVEPLRCAAILDIPGVLDIHTCSECVEDSDCPGDSVCSIDVRLLELTGERLCVAPGSRADGETCDLEKAGAECTSTHCALYTGGGLAAFGVCSECSDDEGCGAGQDCLPPTEDVDGSILPGACG